MRLDSTVGVPGCGYRHVEIEAEDCNCRVVQAVTYMAQGKEVDGKPSLRGTSLYCGMAREPMDCLRPSKVTIFC